VKGYEFAKDQYGQVSVPRNLKALEDATTHAIPTSASFSFPASTLWIRFIFLTARIIWRRDKGRCQKARTHCLATALRKAQQCRPLAAGISRGQGNISSFVRGLWRTGLVMHQLHFKAEVS